MNLTRREAVIRMALLMGASVVGPRLLAGTFGTTPPDFSAADIALLDEIGETIIPATHIPGAKAVGIGAFIAMMITDCYYPAAQASFRAGLAQLPADYEARYGEKFITGQPANRTAFLNALHTEVSAQTAAHAKKAAAHKSAVPSPLRPPAHYFYEMRELTKLGYFTSEIGALQAVGYQEVPGRYDGNVPYKKGDPIYS